MILKIGDILYLNPSKIKLHESNEYTFSGIKFTFDQLVNKPFEVIDTRLRTQYSEGNDICIKWLDGTNWWWGQIGESEPWTKMFIDEKSYSRNRKLEELGI